MRDAQKPERLLKKTLESLAHCIYKQGMSGQEALQSERILDADGNALTDDATIEGIIRSLEHVQLKPDALKRRVSTRVSSRLSKQQKTQISNSTDARPSRPTRRRHDRQPVNSGGTNVQTAVNPNETQRTAYAEDGGNRDTAAAAEDGNAAAGAAPDTTNNADDPNNNTPAAAAAAIAHNNYNRAAAAELDDQRTAADTDATHCLNTSATAADAHD